MHAELYHENHLAIMKKLKKTDGERHHVYILEDASSLQIYL